MSDEIWSLSAGIGPVINSEPITISLSPEFLKRIEALEEDIKWMKETLDKLTDEYYGVED
jgi:hypothetical protein